MEELLNLIAWLVIDLILINTGRAVVFLISLGSWRGEDSKANDARIFSAAGSVAFRRDGQLVVTTTGLIFIGILFHIACALTLIAFS